MQASLFESPDHDLYWFERHARSQGYLLVAGVDEAGRGPLAGPVVAAAVILHPDRPIEGVNDSKKLTEHQRELLFDRITAEALTIGIGSSPPEQIDRINILQATRQAMLEAVNQLAPCPDILLIDGINTISSPLQQQTIKTGSTAGAPPLPLPQIIAKVTRDRLMHEFDRQYPLYGFARHKGYGSASPSCCITSTRTLSNPPSQLQRSP